MERVHSRESVQQREAVKASTSREKSPTSAVQRRESWRERSKSPGSRRASRTSRLDSEDNNVNGGALLDQSSTGDPTKPLSPSLRRRRFHERKVPIARRSSSITLCFLWEPFRRITSPQGPHLTKATCLLSSWISTSGFMPLRKVCLSPKSF